MKAKLKKHLFQKIKPFKNLSRPNSKNTAEKAILRIIHI